MSGGDPTVAAAATRRSSRSRNKNAFLSDQRFDALPIDPRSLRALAASGITHLSRPQAEYLPAALAGADVVVRAATGSGKTLGFLLPVMQLVAAGQGPGGPGRPIAALVLSPTRDLALQTAKVAADLIAGFAGRGVLAIVGGDAKIGKDQARLAREPCDVIVATPGRLMAHLVETAGFRDRLRGVRALVLDEADSMLSIGFLPAVRTIVGALPPPAARQTMLFTATLSDDVLRLKAELMRPEAVKFDVGPSAAEAAAANANIRSEIRVLPPARLVPEAVRLIARHAREAGGAHKVLVFVSTVRHVKFLAALLRATGHPLLRETLELHSGLSSSQRAAAVARLEAGSGVVMIASDVAGRGLDVSDISLVVQIGIALDVAQVVHRAGRTGRGGKGGMAVALVGDDEAPVAVPELRGVLPHAQVVPPASAPRATSSTRATEALRAACERVRGDERMHQLACGAYEASLGFYKSHARRLRWSQDQLVAAVKERFRSLGAGGCPVAAKTLAKMGLRGLAPGALDLP